MFEGEFKFPSPPKWNIQNFGNRKIHTLNFVQFQHALLLQSTDRTMPDGSLLCFLCFFQRSVANMKRETLCIGYYYCSCCLLILILPINHDRNCPSSGRPCDRLGKCSISMPKGCFGRWVDPTGQETRRGFGALECQLEVGPSSILHLASGTTSRGIGS